jgi:lipoprotein-releasing system ATP-binding protein
MSDVLLDVRGLRKSYREGRERLDVLRGIDLQLCAGEMVALVGPSGSGKSTLLHILGLLDRADNGEILLGGEDVRGVSEARRTALRGKSLGFVYQFHHLLPEFSALENVSLPQMIEGVEKSQADLRSDELLRLVGLGERKTHRPAELSGGEQQRVAIARALANRPKMLIADEPTGNLDVKNSALVFNVLRDACQQQGTAILMATHNLELARALSRVIEIRDGMIVEA